MKIKNTLIAIRYIALHPIKSWGVFTPKTKRRIKKIVAVILIVCLSVPGYLWYEKKYGGEVPEAEAGWWNDNWMYRKAITVSNSSGGDLTDFQVKILDNKDLSADITAGKIQADLDDLRFTDINGTVLPYWIEDTTTSSVDVWVKMSSISTTGATVYFYYGNAQASSEQNGNNVFEFFDDFSGTTIDANKWTTRTGTASVSGGELILEPSSGIFAGNYQIPESTVWETRANPQQDASQGPALRASQTSQTGFVSDGGAGVVDMLWWTTEIYAEWNSGEARMFLYKNTTSYNKYKIIYRPGGADTATYYFDGSPTSIWGGNPYTRSGSITQNVYPVVYAGSLQSKWDWTFVRKYASADPVAGAPATEEKGGAPVASWSFDEGTGTTAYDASSNRNNGTLGFMSSTPDPNSGWQNEDKCLSGKCLAFDGSDDSVSSVNPLNITGEVTYSAWINPSIMRSAAGIIGLKNYSPTWGYSLTLDNASLNFRFQDSGSNWRVVNSNSYFSTSNINQWHYVAVVHNGVTTKFFIDGMAQGEVSNPYTSGSASNTVGIGYNGWNYFKGQIDEPRVYNYARTAAQIAKDYNAGLSGMGKSNEGTSASIGGKSNKWITDGLVGHWKMDEASWNGTSGEVKDASGSGNNGTSAGSMTTGTGKYGNGGIFDGIDDKVNIGRLTAIEGVNSSWSIGGWFKKPVSGAARTMFIYDADNVGNTNDLYMYWNGSTVNYQIGGGQAEKVSSITDLTNDVWHHVLMVKDGGNTLIYEDGVLKNNTTYTGSNFSSSYTFRIGDKCNISSWLGAVDDFRIYNRAFSPKEVSDLYNYAPGPVGYWNMDDATGTTAKDLSGNGNNGTLTNGPTWATDGKYGGSTKFDGTDDYVQVPYSSVLAPTGLITVGGWFYRNNWGDSQNEVSISKTENGGYEFYITGNRMRFYVKRNGSYVYPDTDVASLSSGWHYFAGTYDGRYTRIYVDGVLKQTDDAGSNYQMEYANNNPLIIGGEAGAGGIETGYEWTGKIDDVKIYNYARTQKQIVEDMNGGHPAGGSPVGSQVGYWKFDEGNGTTANNSGNGGSALNGTFVSGPTWSNDGKFGKAINFDGSNDHIDIAKISSLEGSSDYSMSAWIKMSSDTNQRTVISQVDSGNHIIAMGINNGYLRFTTYEGGYSLVDSSKQVNDNQWHHVLIKKFGLVGKVYIDGILDGSGTVKDVTNTTSMIIGSREIVAYPFIGLIDEVKVYNHALTDSEVQLDYNQGKSLVLGSKGTESDGKTPSNSASRAYCPPGNVEGNCAPGQNPAPVGEWSLDDGSGTTAKDKSGNGNNGTLTNGPTWVTNGKVGNAVSFDGSDDHINIPYSSVFDLGTNNFSIGAWIKTDKPTEDRSIIEWGGWNSNGFLLRLNEPNNSYPVTIYLGGVRYSWNYSFSSNVFYYLSIVRTSSTTVNAYVNGINLGSQTIPSGATITSGGGATKIGQLTSGSGSANWSGLIDEVKIYSYARTPAQVAWDYNRGAPVGWWRMDDGQGSTARDYSGNGNHGTLTNMDPATDWVAGKNNGALDFDGSNDYVNVGSSSTYDLTSQFTITAWYNTTTGQYLISKTNTGGSTGFGLYLRDNTDKMEFVYQGAYAYSDAVFTESNQWVHVTLTKDSSGNVKFYKNGILAGSTTGVSFSSSSNPLYIGARYDSSTTFAYPFIGQLDDVRIYNYALSAEQVKQVMNEGAVRFK